MAAAYLTMGGVDKGEAGSGSIKERNRMERLNDSIAALVDSYEAYGLINHAGGPNLPSREGIADILRDLEALIFPGFRENETIDASNLRFETAERVNRVARNLLIDVEKSLSFSCRCGRNACESGACRDMAEAIVGDFFAELPQIRRMLAMDVAAAFKGGPRREIRRGSHRLLPRPRGDSGASTGATSSGPGMSRSSRA